MTGVSSIYHRANADVPEGEEARRRNFEYRRHLWRAYGVAVLDPEETPDDIIRQAIINEAVALYGVRDVSREKH